MRDFLFLLLIFLFVTSCNSSKKETLTTGSNSFSFPKNKMWAHRVNTFEEVEKKHSLFEGLEVDLIYSKYRNDFYVAHDEKDTLEQIMFEDWLRHIPNPQKNWYWLDMKNLHRKNAKEVAHLLVDLLSKYGILDKVFCENRDVKSLSVLKKNGIAVSYWVKSDEFLRKVVGNAIWRKKVTNNIAFLKPDALSTFSWMHPLLDSSFPDQNILYWHIPENYTREDDEFIKKLCNLPNVKVVLVDYDEPISY